MEINDWKEVDLAWIVAIINSICSVHKESGDFWGDYIIRSLGME